MILECMGFYLSRESKHLLLIKEHFGNLYVNKVLAMGFLGYFSVNKKKEEETFW